MTIIDKLERADGPDKELDYAIWQLVDPVNAGSCFRQGSLPLPWLHRYTASIDAAMTLVPEGWGYSIKVPSDELPMFIKQADMPKDARVWLNGVQHQGIASTPALALCIAALRARSQGEG